MGYDIYIGNAELQKWDEGDFHVVVGSVKLEEAPSFPNDPFTGKGNSRHPGYSGWHDFCRAVGLDELFFDEDRGLMRSHPGTFAITKEHLAEVRLAKENWFKNHPNMTPGFEKDDFLKEEYQQDIKNADPMMARLLWLEFWMDWALNNCEHPAIHNH